MNKAKDLLLTLLPSASTIVRRAAAEGLALLATVGVTEDAHFLQSALLHSLDEVMQGNKPDGKPKAIAFEPISAARSGSLLTLACIQRTAHYVAQRKISRARERTASRDSQDMVRHDDLPILQMMTRNLPSSVYHGLYKDFFIVRTYALHSLCILLSYSSKLESSVLDDVDKQLLRKGIELIEGNFVASWTASSADTDRGQEAEKMASEVAFLAVLLRLMTFVVPYLHHLHTEDAEIAHRFLVMAALILESTSSHPVILVEAMAFFEVLAMYRDLLSSARDTVYPEHPLSIAIPYVLKTGLGPRIFDGSWSTSSVRGCRAAVRALEALSQSNIPASHLTNMKPITMLVSTLEAVCGCRYFFRSGPFRSLAVSPDQDAMFMESAALEKETVAAATSLLALERLITGSRADFYLRWLLFARQILVGSAISIVYDADIDQYSRAGVVRAATLRTASDTSPVFATCKILRWQVKALAAQLASGALNGLAQCAEMVPPSKGCIDFDPKAAISRCTNMCHEAQKSGGSTPESRLVFHLEDLLASACMSSAATVDHSELRAVQGSAVTFLANLITCFKNIPDPEDPNGCILEQYSTQIFSAVKHALSAAEDCDSYDSARLFQAGCETLEKIVDAKLTKDPAALKRIVRPIVPGASEIPFFSLKDGFPAKLLRIDDKKLHEDSRISALARISKLWAASKLFSGSSEMHKSLESVCDELIPDKVNVAVHCAAVAIDGARLLLGSQLSVAGKPMSFFDNKSKLTTESGFHFQNTKDIGDVVKCALATAWSSCASFSLLLLLRAATSDDFDDASKAAYLTWVKRIIPLIITGVHHSGEALESGADEYDGVAEWACAVDPATVRVDCLRAMGTLVSLLPPAQFQPLWRDEIYRAVDQVRESVILPILGSTPQKEIHPLIVSEVCRLLRMLASANSESLRKKSSLLVTLLTPLDALQKKTIDFSGAHSEIIVSTCISAVGSIIALDSDQDNLVYAMIQLALESNVPGRSALPKTVNDAIKEMLRHCLGHKSVGRKQLRDIALRLAMADNWDAWAIVATIDGGLAAMSSFEPLKKRLRSNSDYKMQLQVLAMLRELTQNSSVPSLLLARITNGIVPDVLVLLQSYGTDHSAQGQRSTVCTDAMKILTIAYQQVSAEGSQDDVTSFLSLLLQVLLAVVRFNGLPNHPSPNNGGDVQLGGLMAQTFVNIARATPGPFKTVLAELNDLDRTLLEFSVRAQMTGYQTAHAPVKKKLDLKSFKK